MLEHKGIEHEVVDWVPRLPRRPAADARLPRRHRAGDRSSTGAGSRARSRSPAPSTRREPDPPLFPADARERRTGRGRPSAGATRSCSRSSRRLAGWIDRPPLGVAAPAWPARLGVTRGGTGRRRRGGRCAWYFAHKIGADAISRALRRTAGVAPPDLLDRVDELIAQGTIGGAQRNAADFQILTTVRLLMTIEDLAPLDRAPPGRPPRRSI